MSVRLARCLRCLCAASCQRMSAEVLLCNDEFGWKAVTRAELIVYG